MQITGTLACGSEVSVLSDAEGYTVNVSTSDGHSGYVASMYLTAVAAPKRAIDKTQTSAMVENNVARWTSGGAGSWDASLIACSIFFFVSLIICLSPYLPMSLSLAFSPSG